MNRKPRLELVMTGTEPHGQGGIASVVRILVGAGLFDRHEGHYIISHRQQDKRAKLDAAIVSLLEMAFVCWRRRPAIVHAHCSTGASFLRKSLLLSIARRFGCATVLHMHGSGFRHFARDKAGWLQRRWVSRTLRRSSAVIALSDSWARFMHELTPSANVHVIHNAVPVPAEPAPLAGGPFRLLFLGEVGQRKGIYELVQAIGRLKDEFPDMRLVVGGDGELERVAAFARHCGAGDHIELLGWIGSDAKALQLAQATAFCLPSHDEGLPVAMLEAMAAARAVLVTPVGGIPEVVTENHNGLLVTPGDVDGLVRQLRRLAADPALCRELGVRGHATMRHGFTAEEMVQQLSELYGRLAGARHPDWEVHGSPAAVPAATPGDLARPDVLRS